jgi:uncharacterized protein YcfL
MFRVAIALFALAACNKQQQPQRQDQNLSMDQGVPNNQVAGNADIETLPADESSTTPSNQLANGFDNPDVNESGNSGSSH